MKTIARIAAETGVSVQTIYRTLNKVKQETGESLTEKINGIAHITSVNEDLLKKHLTNVKQTLNNVKHAENEEIIFLREQNKALSNELATERAHGREQMAKLSELAAQLAELTRNNQLLLGAEQSRTNPALLAGGELSKGDKEPERKKSFLRSIFGRK